MAVNPFYFQMKNAPVQKAGTERKNDRRIIRVGDQPSHAGIAAALRRAFACAENDNRREDDFSRLLSKLN